MARLRIIFLAVTGLIGFSLVILSGVGWLRSSGHWERVGWVRLEAHADHLQRAGIAVGWINSTTFVACSREIATDPGQMRRVMQDAKGGPGFYVERIDIGASQRCPLPPWWDARHQVQPGSTIDEVTLTVPIWVIALVGAALAMPSSVKLFRWTARRQRLSHGFDVVHPPTEGQEPMP